MTIEKPIGPIALTKSLDFRDIIKTKFNDISAMESLISQIRMLSNTYQALSPLKRIKGQLNKVHRLKLNSYSRYLYLNPIEGVLISYNNINKFPHSPNYIIKLNEIIELKMVSGTSWYTKKGRYYFSIKTLSI